MMWMILQADEAEDWVIATGKTTSVRDFIGMAFDKVGIEIEFKGVGLDEKGFVSACSDERFQVAIGTQIIAVDSNYFRPTEVELLIGDATKAREKLGWVPEYQLEELVSEMMAHDMRLMEKEKYLQKGGFRINNYFE
jgi:GDPmannose 4,6-dehydratase